MAEGRGGGRRAGDTGNGRNTARRGDLATPGQHPSALRLRSVGEPMAATPRPGRRHRGAIRRRHRRRFRAPGRRRAVPDGYAGASGGVRPDATPGEDAADRVRTPCGEKPDSTRSRQTRNVRLSWFHPYLRANPAGRVPASAENSQRPGARQNASDQGGTASKDARDGRCASMLITRFRPTRRRSGTFDLTSPAYGGAHFSREARKRK